MSLGQESFFPEVLAPAGSLEKLKVAILYGANAVYLGGQKFGLRTAAENFSLEELEEGVLFAHSRGAKVYVVLNSFLHDEDLEELPEFIKFLETLKVDAVIVSDLGVVETVKQHSNLIVHLSTQASCLNSYAAKLWKKMGVDRVILGRECSIEEGGRIKRESGLEVEMFIHGSMCMAVSGNCTISNYTQGRDSNRGGCAHSCRFEYSLDLKNVENRDRDTSQSFFMSSKDLEGVSTLPYFIKEGIDSVKIEGRMKSQLYAATTAKVYSDAIQYLKDNGTYSRDKFEEWEKELTKVGHRSYAPSNLIEKAGRESVFDERESDSMIQYEIVGNIIEVKEEEFILIEVRNAFNEGDELELVSFDEKSSSWIPTFIKTLDDEVIVRTKPSSLVKVDYTLGAKPLNLVRRKVMQ